VTHGAWEPADFVFTRTNRLASAVAMAPKMTQKQTLEQAADHKRLAAPKGASPTLPARLPAARACAELLEFTAEASN